MNWIPTSTKRRSVQSFSAACTFFGLREVDVGTRRRNEEPSHRKWNCLQWVFTLTNTEVDSRNPFQEDGWCPLSGSGYFRSVPWCGGVCEMKPSLPLRNARQGAFEFEPRCLLPDRVSECESERLLLSGTVQQPRRVPRQRRGHLASKTGLARNQLLLFDVQKVQFQKNPLINCNWHDAGTLLYSCEFTGFMCRCPTAG